MFLSPSIACIGVIGRENNPLYMALFPETGRSQLEFSFLIASSLDAFESRMTRASDRDRDTASSVSTASAAPSPEDRELGLLYAIDERLAMYGWMTATGVKFVIVVDMEGREAVLGPDGKPTHSLIVQDAHLRPAFEALQSAYIALLQNPFYDPAQYEMQDPHLPSSQARPAKISNPRFIKEITRIGSSWRPGLSSI